MPRKLQEIMQEYSQLKAEADAIFYSKGPKSYLAEAEAHLAVTENLNEALLFYPNQIDIVASYKLLKNYMGIALSNYSLALRDPGDINRAEILKVYLQFRLFHMMFNYKLNSISTVDSANRDIFDVLSTLKHLHGISNKDLAAALSAVLANALYDPNFAQEYKHAKLNLTYFLVLNLAEDLKLLKAAYERDLNSTTARDNYRDALVYLNALNGQLLSDAQEMPGHALLEEPKNRAYLHELATSLDSDLQRLPPEPPMMLNAPAPLLPSRPPTVARNTSGASNGSRASHASTSSTGSLDHVTPPGSKYLRRR